MTRLSRSAIALAFLAAVTLSSRANSLRAEYAMRWMPSHGGPATAGDTLEVLAARSQDTKVSSFKVLYFTVEKPAEAPADWTAILRERVGGKKGKSETTWKYRTPDSAAHRQLPWTCPLRSAKKSKDEIDVTILPDGVIRTLSLSCTANGAVAATLSAGTVAKPKGCAVAVTRTEADSVTVEEWRLGSGALVLEVSWKAPETDAAQDEFKANVTSRLAQAGAKALEASKTELASRCS